MWTPLSPAGSPRAVRTTRTPPLTSVSVAVPTTSPGAFLSSAVAVVGTAGMVAQPAARKVVATSGVSSLTTSGASSSRLEVLPRLGHQGGVGQQVECRHGHRLGGGQDALASQR